MPIKINQSIKQENPGKINPMKQEEKDQDKNKQVQNRQDLRLASSTSLCPSK